MERKTIVCFGDSNTHGFNIETGWRFSKEKRFTGRLSSLLGDAYEVQEEGLNGRTSVFEDVLSEGMTGLAALPIIIPTHAPIDLLVMMLGSNDTKARFVASASDITRGIERLVEKAKATKGWRNEPRILLIAPLVIPEAYRKGPFGKAMGEGCFEKSKDLPSLLKFMARRNRIDFLDLNQLEGVEVNQKDFLHLTEESHAVLAEVLADWIRKNL